MAGFDPARAATRFGMGRHPVHADPVSVSAMLAALQGPDDMAASFPIPGIAKLRPGAEAFLDARRAMRRGEISEEAFREARGRLVQAERARHRQDLGALMARAIAAEDGFRERLTLFWEDHFTVERRSLLLRFRTEAFVEDAIRPHLSGRFEQLLFAAETHPVMLDYLDQSASIGPNSRFARHPDRGDRGLNENLAREILELHTLGVDGRYTQRDVRQLAELLAGLTFRPDALAPMVRRDWTEPGREEVLGFVSPDRPTGLEDVRAVMAHLATHPDTAAHLSRKLAVHFVADDPAPDLVAAMTRAWRDTGGDLAAVYEAMLRHPAAWSPQLRKVKRPVEFVLGTLRGLGADPDDLRAMAADAPARFFRQLLQPMQRMGQNWERPGGPDGWPERAAAWITPVTLAERIRWAGHVQTLGLVPELAPGDVLDTLLGPLAGPRLRRAITGSESREDAVALILLSPEFQRR